MLKIIALNIIFCSFALLLFCSFAVFAASENVAVTEAKKVQDEIRYAGYGCERVDGIETEGFFGTIVKVTCDRVFRFELRYERGGVSVEVVNL
ncbi:hypothetical protein [Pantoea ananatis]|uniref:hypothetical protein n=1 Tax=Pantoea ananas TaxID=553 RepID=UPI000497F889|nr:hypothetical protein [Pantoea ananatis]